MSETTPSTGRDAVPGLPDRLRDARKAAGLSQVAAGERSEVGHISIAKFETGARVPTVATLYKLAAAYGCTVCDLLPPGSPPPPPPPDPPKPKRPGR